jgi:nitrogen fixation-related uncharacterized protein
MNSAWLQRRLHDDARLYVSVAVLLVAAAIVVLLWALVRGG